VRVEHEWIWSDARSRKASSSDKRGREITIIRIGAFVSLERSRRHVFRCNSFASSPNCALCLSRSAQGATNLEFEPSKAPRVRHTRRAFLAVSAPFPAPRLSEFSHLAPRARNSALAEKRKSPTRHEYKHHRLIMAIIIMR